MTTEAKIQRRIFPVKSYEPRCADENAQSMFRDIVTGWTQFTQNSYVKVLTPSTSKCDCIWR